MKVCNILFFIRKWWEISNLCKRQKNSYELEVLFDTFIFKNTHGWKSSGVLLGVAHFSLLKEGSLALGIMPILDMNVIASVIERLQLILLQEHVVLFFAHILRVSVYPHDRCKFS